VIKADGPILSSIHAQQRIAVMIKRDEPNVAIRNGQKALIGREL
jgi:hypothetical protein